MQGWSQLGASRGVATARSLEFRKMVGSAVRNWGSCRGFPGRTHRAPPEMARNRPSRAEKIPNNRIENLKKLQHVGALRPLREKCQVLNSGCPGRIGRARSSGEGERSESQGDGVRGLYPHSAGVGARNPGVEIHGISCSVKGTAGMVPLGLAPLTWCRGLGRWGVQACKTPGYSLPVADATVGRTVAIAVGIADRECRFYRFVASSF